MTDAEIDRAISEFEVVGDYKNGWDALFRDPKTRRFWELLYPPDGGPRVLKSITAHDARQRYSAAFSNKNSEYHDYWLEGETLQSVTFILDYWQFSFRDSGINALSRIEVRAGGTVEQDGSDQFRNRLCEQIGKVVERLEIEEEVACTITFEDQSAISISLKSIDYRGPEAINISGAGHFLMVV
jgi:hypothetical protein